jgi:hypothetical protein
MLGQIRVGNGEILDLNDYRGASKDQLLKLISKRNGYLNGVHLDREAFLNLLELQKKGINFSLRGTNLSNIDLSSITYPQQYNGRTVTARIQVANLDLSHAILNGANLSDVIFNNCDMRDAKIRGAYCHGTQFIKCKVNRLNLADATGLTPKQIFKSSGRSEAYYGTAQEQMISGFVKILKENARAATPSKTQQFTSKFTRVIMVMFGNETKLHSGSLFINILELREQDPSFDANRKTRSSHISHKTIYPTRTISAKLQNPGHQPSSTYMPSILTPSDSQEVLARVIKDARAPHFTAAQRKAAEAVRNVQKGVADIGRAKRQYVENRRLRAQARDRMIDF